MNLIEAVFSSVIHASTVLILLVAAHVPPLQNYLNSPAPYTDQPVATFASTSSITSIKAGDTGQPAVAFASTSPVVSIKTADKKVSDESKFEVDSNCPTGVVQALLENNLIPTVRVACKPGESFSVYGKEAKIFDVIYSRRLNYDYYVPVSIKVTLLPSGEVTLSNDYVNLRSKLEENANAFIAQAFPAIPIKNNLLAVDKDISGPNNNNEFCILYTVQFPLSGSIITCTTLTGSPKSQGAIAWSPSAPNYNGMLQAVFAFASSTFPWDRYEAVYGASTEPYRVDSVYYDTDQDFWVFAVKNGYANSFRFIKYETADKISCLANYAGYGSMCP